jgi:hypothetical protein
MKLINLIPLREAEDQSTPELIATPYFREFQTKHGYKPLFKYIGMKNQEHIFMADLEDLGAMDLIVAKAQIMARIAEKEACFGLIYTLTGLNQLEASICVMKQKDGIVEVIPYDEKDKKNFNAKTTKFASLIEQE